MQKILVIGCSGSGKSTFSRALNHILKIPLHHIDLLYHNSDKTVVPDEELDQLLMDIVKNDTWILDGNYSRTMDFRMQYADTVFFLDYPLEVCLEGICLRMGKERPDMPWIETEEDPEFIAFVKDFPERSRPFILELLKKYKDRNIHIFKCREEADTYLKELSNSA